MNFTDCDDCGRQLLNSEENCRYCGAEQADEESEAETETAENEDTMENDDTPVIMTDGGVDVEDEETETREIEQEEYSGLESGDTVTVEYRKNGVHDSEDTLTKTGSVVYVNDEMPQFTVEYETDPHRGISLWFSEVRTTRGNERRIGAVESVRIHETPAKAGERIMTDGGLADPESEDAEEDEDEDSPETIDGKRGAEIIETPTEITYSGGGRMSNGRTILKAVSAGAHGSGEVAEAVDISRSSANTCLRRLSELGLLSREKDGRSYRYGLANGDVAHAVTSRMTSEPGELNSFGPEADDEDAEDEEEPEADEDEDDAESEDDEEETEADGFRRASDGSAPVSEAWGKARSGETVGTDAETLPGPSDTAGETVSVSGEGAVPVLGERDYEFTNAIPTDVPEYKPSGGEYRRIMLDIANRHESGRLPRFLVGGPTASGKSLLAEHVASELGIPLFTIQCNHGMRQSSLIGKMALLEDETVWVDSVMVHALLASREGPVMVLIDEMNRAPAKYKDTFFSFLDDRCQVNIPDRGNEVVKGNPENLITIATINEGSGYAGTEKMDRAELRRYGNKFDVDYLGVNHPESEVELITERTPVPEPFADRLVSVANEIRTEAREERSAVKMGLPTGKVLDWARTAWTYDADETISEPGIAAATDVFIEMLFNDEQERQFVEDAVEDGLSGVGVFDGVEDGAGGEEDVNDELLSCSGCGYETVASELSDEELGLAICPNCDDGTLVYEN